MRTLTADGLKELLARSSSQAWLQLLTISHSSFSTVRVVDNTEDISHNGNTYTAFPFMLSLPQDTEDKIPEITVRADNVGRDLVTPLRTATSAPSASLEIVRVAPDGTVVSEAGPWSFRLSSFQMDEVMISAKFTQEADYLNEPRTNLRFTPIDFPGMFQ